MIEIENLSKRFGGHLAVDVGLQLGFRDPGANSLGALLGNATSGSSRSCCSHSGSTWAWGWRSACLLLSSAPAIVAFFVVPTAWLMLGALVPRLADVAGWFDLSQAIGPLAGPGSLTRQQRLHVLTATALWVALPAVAGVLRVRRAEVT